MSDDQKFHEYDGIIEHDNPLPTWWLWTFFLTIIFAFIYYIHYTFTPGITLNDELHAAMQELEKTKATAASVAPMETEESLAAIFAKPEMIEMGASQFATKCAACHGIEMQGLIGPDLTDKYWIHGEGTRTDIVKVVREGIPEKGMPPWGPVMKRDEIYAVTAYILAKKGSQPAGSKGPQGEPHENYLK